MHTFELPELAYAYDALEPYIDRRTMELHYTKHHQGYVNKLNKALKEAKLAVSSLADMLRYISNYPMAVRNNGGGHFNHTLFWSILSPKAKKMPTGSLAQVIENTFGNLAAFKEMFNHKAATLFGSGWVWLCVDSKGVLQIITTPNQDNPLMEVSIQQGTPILGLDVWEHAYYLKYQNQRPLYIEAFWHVLDWTAVETNYEKALL